MHAIDATSSLWVRLLDGVRRPKFDFHAGFDESSSSFVGEGGQDVPGWTCFVSRLRFVAEFAARLRIEGEPGRLLPLLAAEPQDEGEPSVESEFNRGECAPYCESSSSSNNDACSPGNDNTKP